MGDSHSPRNSSGRKRSHDDGSDDPSGKKMKNREAARKCREKKVKETEDLKKKNAELMEKNRELSSKKDNLEKTLLQCIMEIKKHKLSGCTLPKDVEDIINLPEFAQDFCPDGIQTISPQSSFDTQASLSDRSESVTIDTDSDSDVPAEEIQPTIKGLFTGQQLPVSVSHAERNRTRNPSSRSPSRSPPTPPTVSANRNHIDTSSALSSSSSFTSSRFLNGTSKIALQPTWNLLHEQTMNGQASPGMSPVQTVPNIDPDWERVPHSYPKQNGFPDIDEAVRSAQKDPGVVEDAYFTSFPVQHHKYANSNPPGSERSSLVSLGFTPNVTAASGSSIQYNSSSDDSIQYTHQAGSVIPDTLRPSTSNSTTISMNYTAELLSQAITNNFDASEISEDLKNQYVQLAKTEETVTSQPQETQSCAVNEQYVGAENNGVQYQGANATQLKAVGESDQEISYENLLRLAKDQENITVQYQGKEYSCNYDQVEQLIKYISNQKTAVEITNDVTVNDGQAQQYCVESPATHTTDTKKLINHANDASYITQNQAYALQNIQNSVAAMNCSIVGVDDGSNLVAPIQPTHLPTTVLSMIEEDSQQPQSQPTAVSVSSDTYVDGVDYSDNVRDLPSLSLTEDHTNIFEKKRKNPP